MRLTYNAQKFMVTVAAIAMFCAGTAMARETVFVKNGDSYVTKSDDDIYQMNAALEPVTKACSSVDGLDVKNGDVTVVNGDLDGLYKYGDVAKFECNTGVKKTYYYKKSGVTLDLTSAKAGRAFPTELTSIDIAEAKKINVLNENMKVKKVYENCPNNKVPGNEIGKDESKCYEKVTIYDVRVACRALQKAGDGKSSVFMQSSFCAAKYSGVTASKDKCYGISGDKLCSYSENGDAPSTSESATCYDGFTKKTSGTFYKSETDSVTAKSDRPYCTNPTSGYFYGNPSDRPYTEYYDASVTFYEGCSYTNVNGAKSDKIGSMGKSFIAMQNGKKACFLEPNTEANGNHTLKITGSSTAASVKVNAPVNVRLENTTIKGNQAPALDLDGNYNHTVYFSGTNTLTGADGKAAVRKASNSGYMLTIVGDATDDAMLKANGGSGAAGIGGNEGEAASKIVIREGVVTAVAGDNATYGIGPGANANDDGGAVVIAGGSIKATNAGGGDAINAVDEQNEPVHLLKFGTEDVEKLYIQSSKKDEYGKEGDIQAAEKYAAKFFPTRHGDEDNVYLYLGEKEEHDLMVNPNVSEDGKTVTSRGKTSRVKWDAYKSMFVYNLAFLDSYLHDVLVYNGHEQSVVVDSAKIWMLNKLVKLEPGKNFALDNEKLTNANVTCKEAYVERNVDINATAVATTPEAKYCDAEKYVENADSLYKVEPVNNDERFYGYVQHKKTMLPYVLDNMDFVNAEKQFDVMGLANTNDPVKQKGGADSLVYNGAEQTQWIDSVVLNNVLHYPNSQFANYKLDAGTDYEVSDNKQTDIGTYTLTISAKGSNFVGKATRQFAIKNLNVDGEGCYVIASSVELYTFADVVTNASSGKICAKLTKDIVVNTDVLEDGALNGVGSSFTPWTPMNVKSGVKVTFDGNGHTISGLYFNEERENVGLFGLVKYSLSISNLGIEDSYFKGFARVGGLVGRNDGGTLTIENSYNAGTVSGGDDSYEVGGLVGYASGGLSITNSYNAGAVSGAGNYVGGLVGYASGGLSITNSYNAGAVSGAGNYVGGLVGYGYGELSIMNSYNAGSVSGGEYSWYVGGLVGYAYGTLSIMNSYNAGAVRGTGDNVGGLVGDAYATLSIMNSYNAGAVSGGENSGFVGGLVGYANGEWSVTNSFFPTGEYNVYYGGTETSLDDFHNGSVARNLHDWCEKEDGSETCKVGGKNGSVWGQDLIKENSLPDLSGKITGTLYDLVLHTFDDDNRSYPTYYLSEKGLELPTGLTRENHIFLGWSAKETAGSSANIVTSIAKGETGKKEFYAQWMKLNADGCYEIASGIALYKFAEIVNNATNGSQVCGTLVDNIVVNTDVLDENGALNGVGSSFTPWNPMTVVRGVQVTLDGAGKTISGLYFNDENQYNVGLFGDVRGELSISDLGIVDSYFRGEYYVGGLVGLNREGDEVLIANSYNAGTVSGRDFCVGGLVGSNGAGMGFVGMTITNSYNTGAVSGAVDVGGLVGCSDHTLSITNSYNTGAVSGAEKVGGLVGYADDELTITNSYNVGAVSGSDRVGGLVGRAYGTLSITNSYNVGAVSGGENSSFVGGLVGVAYGELSVTNSFFLGEGDNYGVFGKTTTEFHDGTVVSRLHYYSANGVDGSIWGQDLNDANSLPDFSGKIVGGGASYKLTLHTFEGKTLDYPKEYIEQLGLELPTNVTREGYIFLGWSTKEKAASDADFVTSIAKGETGEKKFYAQWKKLNGDGCFEIASTMELYEFANFVTNASSGKICGKLTNDITVNGEVLDKDGALNGGDGSKLKQWTPMNVKSGVKVTFDGNGHTISGLYFNEERKNVGLFGLVKDSLAISNLGVVDSYFKGKNYVGGLVGYTYYAELSITNSYNAGSVSGGDDSYEVGGLVGYASGELSITNSYNAGSVSGGENSRYVGGLVGYTYGEFTITNSFFLGEGDNYGGFGKTTTEFHNGTVATLLRNYVQTDCEENCIDGTIWGQDLIKENSLPDLSGVIGIKYSLTLYTFEGKTLDYPKEYIEQLGLELPTNVTREGYIFLGWSTKEKAASDADIVTSIAKNETGAKTFYAQWMKVNEKGCYEIASGIGLYTFAGYVDKATNGSQVCGTLVDNIVVNTGVLNTNGALNGDGSSFTPWNPMTVVSGVQVTLDGNGKTISGLYFNDEKNDYVGLFGDVLGTVSISDLGVNDSYFKGHNDVGGLVGVSSGILSITNSYNAGSVSGGENSRYVGGLVGYASRESKLSITNSYNAGSVSGKGDFVGGLVGCATYGTLSITNSYNAGSVSGKGDFVGGLVGCATYGTLSITNSYNAGAVSGGDDSYGVGGLVGLASSKLSITNSYNAGSVSGTGNYVGGLVGRKNGTLTITNSFFLATGKNGDNYGGTETSLDDFHNGTVARNLHDWCEKEEGSETCKVGGKNGSVWGQDLNDANSLPDFSGEIGHKYGSVVFFDKKADGTFGSAHVDATSELTVDFPNDVVVSGPVTFKRPFAGNGYSTIMLPFTPNCVADDCIEGVKFYEFGSYANATVGITEVSPSALKANTPYLVSAAGATELVFKNGGTFNTTGGAYDSETGEYKKVLEDDEGNVIGWTIYGTYDYKTWEEGDAGLGRTYGFAANDGVNNPAIVGQFTKVGAGAHIYPMRAYLEYVAPVKQSRPAANGAARAGAANTVASLPETINVVIVDKDETSGEQTTRVIGTINTRTGEFKFATDRWFDLNGRYLGEKKPTQKGAYYNNGKKVIVK